MKFRIHIFDEKHAYCKAYNLSYLNSFDNFFDSINLQIGFQW